MRNERVYELLDSIPDMELYAGTVYTAEWWCRIFIEKFQDEGDTENRDKLKSLVASGQFNSAMDFISDYFNVGFELSELAPTRVIYSKMFYENALSCLMSEKLVLTSNIERCKHLFSKEERVTLEIYSTALAYIFHIVKHNKPSKETMQAIVKTYEYILKSYGKAFENAKDNYKVNKGKEEKKND